MKTKIVKWGNSCAVRLPSRLLKEAGMEMNDVVCFDVDDHRNIVISKRPVPKKGTIEYLFKDYSGESFKSELVDLGEPVGNEKWR
jgi:antitoxin component of MazEF toxin-antitoxin module